jgi:hypothetical protein
LAIVIAAGLIDDLHGRPDAGGVFAGEFQLMGEESYQAKLKTPWAS